MLGFGVRDLDPYLDLLSLRGGGRGAGRSAAGIGRAAGAADEEQREQDECDPQRSHRRTNSIRLFWRPLLLWLVISICPTSRVLATLRAPSAWVSRPSISTIRITRTRSGTRLTWVRMRSGFCSASSRGSS